MVPSPDADLLTTALDVFPAEAALLAADGEILYTNDQWRAFGLEDALVGADAATVGENYLAVVTDAEDTAAQQAAEGLDAVLANEQGQFTLEYQCHSSTERHWFLMTVQGFDHQEVRYAVIGHLNITDRRLAEFNVKEQTTFLEGLHKAVHDLLETDSQAEAAERAVLYLDRVLDFPIVGLWLYDEARDVLAPAAISEQSETLIDTVPTCGGDDSLS